MKREKEQLKQGNGERRKTKKITIQEQTMPTKKDILKQRKKCLPANRERMHQLSDASEAKQFWRKIWKRRYQNRKAEEIK